MLKRLTENTLVHILILTIIAVVTFFPATEMHFYLDEWGNIYEFTHHDYKFSIFTAHVFNLLYQLFGIDPTGYFSVGIGIFALSVIAFYLLVSNLLKNKTLGVVAGLFYATTPVGIDTTTMIWTYVIEGGYPLNVVLLILLFLLLKYFRDRRIIYFLIALFGFFLFIELEPRRGFLYLPILILFDYIINFKSLIPSLGFIARAASLVAVFITYYKYNVTLTGIFATGRIIFNESVSTYDVQTKIGVWVHSLTSLQPWVTFTNILLAGPWVFISDRLTGYVDVNDASEVYLLVLATIVAAGVLVFLAFRVKRELGLLLIFSLGWIYFNIIGIYIFSSPGISGAVHRTLSLAAPAYALFFTISGFVLFTYLKSKRTRLSKNLNNIFFLALIVLLGTNFLATRNHFEKFNDFRSRPAHAFFKSLKTFYPTLPPNSILYFQSSSNPQIKYRLSRIYGGNLGPEGTISSFYKNLKRQEIKVVHDYVEVEKFVGNDSAKINRVFAFYFDEKGLQDITENFRSQLKEDKEVIFTEL